MIQVKREGSSVFLYILDLIVVEDLKTISLPQNGSKCQVQVNTLFSYSLLDKVLLPENII